MGSAPLFTGAAAPLTARGFNTCAEYLNVPHAELWAVLQVETAGCGYFPNRRPAILFERHHFARLTGGRFNGQFPNISNPEPGGYVGGMAEYARLEQALALDAQAALKSASWGLGQVMGFNAPKLLLGTSVHFVRKMMDSEDEQLAAMAGFIWMDGGRHELADALRRHDWAAFARRYNGPGYKEKDYDGRLEKAYRRLCSRPLPDLTVREAQVRLTFLRFFPGPPDGELGPLTKSALTQFQHQQRLPPSGLSDILTLDALRSRCAELPRNEVVPETSAEVAHVR